MSQFVMSAVSREFQKHPCHKTDLVITFTDVFRIVDNLVYKKKSIDVSLIKVYLCLRFCVYLLVDHRQFIVVQLPVSLWLRMKLLLLQMLEIRDAY